MKMRDLQIDSHLGGGFVASAIFTHILPSGENIHIAARLLRDWCRAQDTLQLERFRTPIDQHLAYKMVNVDLSVDPRRVLALRPQDRFEPIIYCKDGKFTDGRPDVFLVDGHHRYVRAAMEKEPYILAWVLNPDQWLPFKIEDAPSITAEQLRRIDPGHPLTRGYWKNK